MGLREFVIPEEEIQLTFARSSGAGGQNVNKVESKVILHWNVGKSTVFSDVEKDRIRKKLINKLNQEDELVLSDEEERSQLQNRENVVQKLHDFIQDALFVPKKRKKTVPTKSSDEKRIKEKKIRSEVKELRREKEL